VGELLDCARVVFPPLASVLSAFGTLVTPVRLDLMRSALGDLAALDWTEIDALHSAMRAEGGAALAEAGVAPEQAAFAVAADMRYRGQQNEVTTALAEATLRARDAAAMREAFEGALADVGVEVVTWRLSARGPVPGTAPPPPTGGAESAPRARRPVHLDPAAPDWPVYDRAALAVGQRLTGPAVVEERETTLVVLPGWTAEVHPTGAVVARREG
jgi:N-methylhydantoinase A